MDIPIKKHKKGGDDMCSFKCVEARKNTIPKIGTYLNWLLTPSGNFRSTMLKGNVEWGLDSPEAVMRWVGRNKLYKNNPPQISRK